LIFCISCTTTEEEITEPPQIIEETLDPNLLTEVEPAIDEPTIVNKNSFEVTEEIYKNTFNEIEALIKELNQIIFERKYNTWKSYLDEKYIEEIGAPAYLAQFSDRPILKKYNVKLRSLNDYFEFVVVPSRSNAKLDEIFFVDENKVTAYMFIQNQKTILYQLRYDGKRWKISIW